MGLCFSARKTDKKSIYFDTLPENLKILLWNYCYFKTNHVRLSITNYEKCQCYQIEMKEKIVVSDILLQIKDLYSTNTYLAYDVIAGSIRETTDLVYSIQNGRYILLKCLHSKIKDKYASLNQTECDTHICLTSDVSVLNMSGECIFYVTSNPYLFKPYFSTDTIC